MSQTTPPPLSAAAAPPGGPKAGITIDHDLLAGRPKPRLALIFWALYAIAVLASVIWLALTSTPLVSLRPPPGEVALAVPARVLPAFHLIQTSDLTTTTLPAGTAPTNALTDATRIAGTLTLAPLAAGQIITEGMVLGVPDAALLDNALVVAIAGPPALVFGGALHPGMVITAWRGPDQLAERLLVLDVRRADPPGATAALAGYVVVLAVPATVRESLSDAANARTLSFTQSP